jgi:hypothetical protein
VISALFRRIRQLTEKVRFRSEINKHLEEVAGGGEINDIESAIVLARTGVAEARSYLYKALTCCKVFALCQSEDDPKSYVSVRSPGDFRVYVVFTTRKRAEPNLTESRGGVLVEQPFYHVLDAVPVGLGIIVNPLDVAVRLDIDPPEINQLINDMVAEAKSVQARKEADKN